MVRTGNSGPDSPGPVEGDRGAVVARSGLARALMVGLTRTDPARNQAEGGHVARPVRARGILNDPAPVLYVPGFGGFVGTAVVRAAQVIPITSAAGYGGIMPVFEQPKLAKPYPYKERR